MKTARGGVGCRSQLTDEGRFKGASLAARLMKYAGAALLLVMLGCLALRPGCVPPSAEQLAQFSSPIEQRTDRDFHLRVFQLRAGRWHQCKTWLSRQFFF